MKPQRIIWHHSAIASNTSQLVGINDYHRARGFPQSTLGYWVGYHYLIEPNGAVVRCRAEDEIGAHDAGENINSLGICLAGNFDDATPSDAQAMAFARLIKDIRTRWPIPLTRIEPHRWDDQTNCPGLMLPDNYAIENYLAREGTPLEKFFLWIGQQFKLL